MRNHTDGLRNVLFRQPDFNRVLENMNHYISWNNLKKRLQIGQIIEGIVLQHEPFGIFVDVGYDYQGIVQITDFKDSGVMTLDQYPDIGQRVSAVILGFKESGQQIWLGMKPSQLNQLLPCQRD